jgi:hypothetical protein
MNKLDNLIFNNTLLNTNKNTNAANKIPDEKALKSSQTTGPHTAADKTQLSSNSQVATRLVYQSVSLQFSSSSGVNIQPKIDSGTEQSTNSMFDFQAVADTVMSFISESMFNANENGASDEELAVMFEQANIGINRGIDEALSELGELSLLDESLEQGIEKSRSLITEGIERLGLQFLAPINEEDTDPESLSPSGQANNASLETSTTTTSADRERYASNRQSADLVIQTTDGDTVSISFSQLQERASVEGFRIDNSRVNENASERGLERGGRNSQASAYAGTRDYNEVNFSFTVEGELDEDELAAIETLIKDVGNLQKDFFNGNIELAYEKSLKLGFDNEQIASLSLDLQQTQTHYASQTYAEVAGLDDKLLPKQDKSLKPLLDFIEQLKQVEDKSAELFNNKDTFGQLLEGAFNAQFGQDPESLNQFMQFTDNFTSNKEQPIAS